MKLGNKRCLICNCEKSMPLDAKKLSKALGVESVSIHEHLCRIGLPEYETALKTGEPLLVGCTQESPLFLEIADEDGAGNSIEFVNIRETAGWSEEANIAAPKIAALLKDSEFAPKPARLKAVTSDGMCLVYGSFCIGLEYGHGIHLGADSCDPFVCPHCQ